MTRRLYEARQPIWSARRTESARGEQVAVLGMFPQEVRGIRAARLDLQVLRARKIKSGARHARGESTTFDRLRRFREVNNQFSARGRMPFRSPRVRWELCRSVLRRGEPRTRKCCAAS